MIRKKRGFTIIELIIVIVILGILAAFIIPKYGALDKEARIAVVQGLAGSIRGAAAIAHGVSLAQKLGPSASVTLEGQAVTMSSRYPTADAEGITAALSGSLDDFTPTEAVGPPPTITYERNDATTPATCSVVYENDTGVIGVTVTTTGC